jgi:RpiR family transcriptional regulator, carbohydrate utilization regulator
MLLELIRGLEPQLAASQARVAQAVLAKPSRVVDENITALAKAAKVSEPTVVRFCRTVGCDGWQDFKLKVSQALALHVPNDFETPQKRDLASDLIEKICTRSVNVLMNLRASVKPQKIEAALDLLMQAARVEIYGQGTSGIVAQDAQHKLFRTGLPCVAYADPYVHSVAAALLDKSAVVIAISQRGNSVSLMKSVELARKSGAKIIVLAPASSALAKLADVLIAIDMPAENDGYTPISTRLAHLAIIDVFAVGLSVRRGESFAKRVRYAQTELRSLDMQLEDFVERESEPKRVTQKRALALNSKATHGVSKRVSNRDRKR